MELSGVDVQPCEDNIVEEVYQFVELLGVVEEA